MRIHLLLLAGGLLLPAFHANAQAKTGYKLERRYALECNGRFDFITLDPPARRLYISHGDHVDVMDADSGKLLGKGENTPGVRCIAIAPKLKRGFTSNSGENKVSVFDTDTLALIKKIDVGKDPYVIYLDSASLRVFVATRGSSDITAIDAEKGEVVGTVKVGGSGENMVTNSKGLVFVNLEDKAEVVSFDPRTLQIKNSFPIVGGKLPMGLAIDRKNNRLFISCGSKVLAVMDADTGKVLATMPVGGGAHNVAYDAANGLIFTSNEEGNVSIIRQKSADAYELVDTVATQVNAKMLAFDPRTRKLFLPVHETIPAAAAGQRPGIVPGTFAILVVWK